MMSAQDAAAAGEKEKRKCNPPTFSQTRGNGQLFKPFLLV
jgi:hypothetical protein